MPKDTDPRMHTAEHILNQTMIRLFGTDRCFSAHIEKKKSKCDYHFNRPLNQVEAEQLATAINTIINQNLLVTAEMVSRSDAERLYNLGRLPEGQGEEEVRIVKIGDYDAVPCVGPHVAATKEIGQFRLISNDFSEGVLRIRYKLS